MDTSYWLKQEPGKALFPDIEWNKPERRDLAGRLAIIGGHKLGFLGVATAYNDANDAGAGTIRVVVPDTLKKAIPPSVLQADFLPSNISGGFSKDAEQEMLQTALWADGLLLAGDNGRNSETAMLLETLLLNTTGMLTVTRDSIDLLSTNTAQALLERPNTVIIASFAQLQKLLRSVHFPRGILFSMHLAQLVEIMHKVSLSFEATFVTYHQEHIIIANQGQVLTQPYGNPMTIWRGSVAAKAAAYLLWNPKKPLEAITSSLLV
jgi:NAD(P)H-hydrate repair Nnr-like enzyme with NAD(P)H-hydrate dehydratase domain